MNEAIIQYRLLSFIVAHKAIRRNSYFPVSEKKYILAKKIGISVFAYSRNLEEGIKRGYIQKTPHGNRFISLAHVICDMFCKGELRSFRRWRRIRFFRADNYSSALPSYKEILERIKFEVAALNYKEQQHKINQTNRCLGFLKYRANNVGKNDMRLLKKVAKYHSCSIESLPRILRYQQHIKTGKYHTGNLLGVSPSTGLRLLWKWQKNGLIKRQKQYKNYKVAYTDYTHELLSHKGYPKRYTTKNGKQAISVCIGCKIELYGWNSSIAISGTPKSNISTFHKDRN